MEHVPVLLREVLTALNPKPHQVFIDATLGDGGHSTALLKETNPDGRLLGLDQDRRQIEVARHRLAPYGDRVTLTCVRFARLADTATEHGFTQVDGILFDLGISSRQLNTPEYGLSFDDDAPLDMRLSEKTDITAAEFLNRSSEVEIADTLYHYGDRHNSRTLARKIMLYRRKSMFSVAKDVKTALNLWSPAQLAPIFQAIRIRVNDEFADIEAALPQTLSLLRPGGKLAVISFHSGEDRLVKHFMRQHRSQLKASASLIQPSFEEIKRNPRSRSAKLRIAEKLET